MSQKEKKHKNAMLFLVNLPKKSERKVTCTPKYQKTKAYHVKKGLT